jgi:putative DNA primase/helicase
MATLDQVVNQMAEHGLPQLPHGHPVLDGKIHRFGPGRKAWYVLRELDLDSGRRVVTGAFGIWQGTNQNAIPVKLDWEEVSSEERADIERKQRAFEEKEAAKKLRQAEMAANRARMQWSAAAPLEHEDVAPYLARKQVAAEGLRVQEDGTILVPMKKYTRSGATLVGLQKIAPDGAKRYSKGMDKIGAGFLLGTVSAETVLIGMGEGYATGATVRLATKYQTPVMLAFDAGSLLAVARQLRADFPDAHILFFADDDDFVAARLTDYLLAEFKVSAQAWPDGVDRALVADDGNSVQVKAQWRRDACGTPYIEADIRAGRLMRITKFENAGLSRARAAAKAVGNASVVVPVFAARGENRWSDFNDLQVEESLQQVADQVGAALAHALSPDSVVPEWVGVDLGMIESPAPSEECKSVAEPEIVLGQLDLQWALAHCALIQGATDVWDSLNKLRMKRAAFVDLIGKDAAKTWTGHAERRSISPRNLPKIIRGVAAPAGEAGGVDNIVMMLDRYTLLYGTKTVWDADKRTILGYDAMALARGNDLASRWIGHPLHREIDLDKLVFDPTQRVDLNNHINMFEGFPLTPKKDADKVDLVLALLYSLCASEANQDDVFRWVLRWLAFPLQHPGAKMQTALLFFGEKQGTGKSLFFEGIVKPIYGAHGATGGQHQLESTYTMWRSQKLFVLFEEILSRQDKYSYFGLIKHMITGRDTPISQKFKDDRTEANHLNCVMLSNEFQAIPLEPEDRRFLVVDVRQPLDDTLLAMITAALNDGLIEAFYAFLLEYPLEGFTAHTKPIMTPSKERVINFGRPDWEAFYLSWSSGEMGVPYCSCLSKDLYVVYSRYCSKFGFRSMSLTKFSELIAQRVKKDRQWITMGAASAKNLLTVFHVPLPEGDEPETLSKQCDRFRSLADIKETA